MQAIDIWSFITGVIGILSFLLAAWDKFPKWKNYLQMGGGFILGFALGRISPVLSPASGSIFGAPQTATSFFVLFLIIAFGVVCFIFMVKKDQTLLAYFMLLMIFFNIPTVLKSFPGSSKMSSSDLLILASTYEQKQNIDKALEYLERYLETTNDKNEIEQIKNKITSLKTNRISNILGTK